MSTKIYNGYRFHGDRAALGRLVEDLRTELGALALSGYIGELAREAAGYHDRAALGLPEACPVGTAPLVQAEAYLAEQQAKLAKGLRSPRADFGSQLAVLDSPDGGPLYVLAYSERDELLEAWSSVPGVEHWPYWDNTDRPGDVSEAEWDRRRRAWDAVAGWKSPAEVGTVVDFPFSPPSAEGHLDQVVAAVPSIEARAASAASYAHPGVSVKGGRLVFDHDDARQQAERVAAAQRFGALLRDLGPADLITPWAP